MQVAIKTMENTLKSGIMENLRNQDLTETSYRLVAIQAQLNNIGREIRKTEDYLTSSRILSFHLRAIRNQELRLKLWRFKWEMELVVENMDGYRDQDMGDVIVGEPFYKASCVEARRFDGLITIHNGNDNVTYQMAQSYPRFRHLSNAQCKKIKPLLKATGESLHEYYLRFTLLLNDMNIYKMPLEQFQVNTKFLNTLPAEWSKFVTDVKLVKDLNTTNVDQIHAHLEQHEWHANEVRLMHERNSDHLALVASHQMT
ncbi:hypothetical protein Tco_0096743 [Tanacetum coccineum]